MSNGHIQLHRKLTEWEWYKDANTKAVFLHLLLTANWKDTKYKGVTIPRGSVATTLPELTESLNLSIQQARTALQHLKSTGEITDKRYSKFRVVEINNYEQYQISNSQNNRKSTVNQQSEQQPINSHVKDIYINNTLSQEEEINIPPCVTNVTHPPKGERYFEDDTLNATYEEFLEFRKQIKKPIKTALSLEKNKAQLVKLASESGSFDATIAVEILNRSMANGWQGLFPLKGSNRQKEARNYDRELEEQLRIDGFDEERYRRSLEEDRRAAAEERRRRDMPNMSRDRMGDILGVRA